MPSSPLLTLLAAALPLLAQTPTCPDKEIPVSIAVTVLDPSGDPAPALVISDFVLKGAKSASNRILSVSRNVPGDYVLLLEDRERHGLMSGAASLFLSAISPEDRVAVYFYGTSARRQLAFTNDKLALQRTIESAATGVAMQQNRPLLAAAEAAKAFDTLPATSALTRRRAILMLGDDRDLSSQVRIETIAANLLERRASLDLAIDPLPVAKIPGLGMPVPRIGVPVQTTGNPSTNQPLAPLGVQSATKLAQISGGKAVNLPGASFLKDMLDRIQSRYWLTYCTDKKSSSRPPSLSLNTPGYTLQLPGRDAK